MNRYKLEYEMKSRGITIEKLCSDIGMSRSASIGNAKAYQSLLRKKFRQL